MNNRTEPPFAELVGTTFTLDQLNETFASVSDRSMLPAAIIP